MAHHVFHDGAALAARLAADVAAALSRRIAATGEASLVVSGGRTPLPFLRELSTWPLDWKRVHVTLADERCVPAGDAASNQRFVREALGGDHAAAAHLVSFDASEPGAAAAWQARLAQLPRPFAAVVLGMGEDGHIASLFPRMPGLEAALDLAAAPAVVAGLAPVEPRARLTMNLAALLEADLLALHVTGPAKLATLQRAGSPGSPLDLPVRALLRQRRVPLEVYHAP